MPAVKKVKHDPEKAKTEICSQKKVKEAINALKLLEEKFVEKGLKKQPLLENGTESLVFLQIILKKIPPPQLLKMIGVSLPHSLISETSEVCLITGDLEKRNHKAEVEPTVLHYKDLLKKHGVTNVAQVIPLRQLRTEYKTFESRRQLAAAYDVFLVDKKIAGVVPKTLGKSFFQGRKFPLQIDLRKLNLKEEINKALHRTKFSLACRGNSYALEVARLSMENDAVLENIMTSIEVLANKLPGKENNILSLYLKTAKSKAIPFYMSLDISDDILIKKPRKNERVGLDELSTMDDAQVKVFRDGKVILIKTKKNSNNEDAAVDDANTNLNEQGDVEENEDDTQESTANEVSLKKKKKKGKKICDLIEITDTAELENKEHTQDSVTDKTSPKKKKKSKKSTCLDQGAASSQVENEDIQDSVTTEISLKKKKKGKKYSVDISDNEVDSQNTPSKASTKKNKKNKNSSYFEAGEAIEDNRESSMFLSPKKQKIYESDNVDEKVKKFKNKGRKVSENEDNDEIEKNSRSKIHRSISEVADEDIKVKTPKSKKEKKAKDVIDVAKNETTLTFIEDKETMQNEKTPSRSKKLKKENTEVSITPTTPSMSKRKKSDVKNNLESDKRQKRHKHTAES